MDIFTITQLYIPGAFLFVGLVYMLSNPPKIRNERDLEQPWQIETPDDEGLN